MPSSVAVNFCFHADELRVEIVARRPWTWWALCWARGDSRRRRRRWRRRCRGHICPRGNWRCKTSTGTLDGVDAGLAVTAEGDGTDVAGGDAVRFDGINHGLGELVDGVAEGHAVDVAGIAEALHVVMGGEKCWRCPAACRRGCLQRWRSRSGRRCDMMWMLASAQGMSFPLCQMFLVVSKGMVRLL